jgi:O-antigen ligase
LQQAIWLVWKASEILLRQRRVSRLRVFAIAPILVIASIVLLLWLYPEGVLAAVDRLPGLPSGESRLDLARSTLYLIADYPWSGAGLASFAGIYSQYIKVIPHPFFEYGHNFYLDLAVEQGLFCNPARAGLREQAGITPKSLEYGLNDER